MAYRIQALKHSRTSAVTSAGMFIAHVEDKATARKLAGGAALRLIERLKTR